MSYFASLRVLKNISRVGIVSSTNLLHTNQICYKKKKEKKETKETRKRPKGCGPIKVAVVCLNYEIENIALNSVQLFITNL